MRIGAPYPSRPTPTPSRSPPAADRSRDRRRGRHIGRVQGHPIYGLVVMFAAFTGLRAGELAGLNVGDLTLPQVPGSAGSV